MYIHYLINGAVGKIVPKELLDTSLSQTFDLLKNIVSAKCSMTRCICNGKQYNTLLPRQLTIRAIPTMCWWCSLVGWCSVTKSCPSLCDPHGLQHARLPCPSPSPGVCSNSIQLVMPSNHLILCHPLLLLPSVFPRIRVFSSESALHNRWPKYRSFSFSVSPSSEYSGLISFRIDWFDLLAVQDSQKSSPVPQFESISSLVLSLLYGPTLTSVHDYWKNHSFDYMDFISKAMSLLLHWLLL